MRPVPAHGDLIAAGVRRCVAREYRRLLTAGVSSQVAVVLARGQVAPVPDWTQVAADYLRDLAVRGSTKGNCVRWHGPDCGCWGVSA